MGGVLPGPQRWLWDASTRSLAARACVCFPQADANAALVTMVNFLFEVRALRGVRGRGCAAAAPVWNRVTGSGGSSPPPSPLPSLSGSAPCILICALCSPAAARPLQCCGAEDGALAADADVSALDFTEHTRAVSASMGSVASEGYPLVGKARKFAQNFDEFWLAFMPACVEGGAMYGVDTPVESVIGWLTIITRSGPCPLFAWGGP